MHTRLVDRLALHGPPLDFRALCERAVPPETRYLVLDLDRTLHLGRNMGELLGWELSALFGYGAEHLALAEPRRRPGRFFVDRSRPLAALRYLLVNTRMWALPGLVYFLAAKLPSWFERLRRRAYRAFGPEPVAAVQLLPQTVLLHHMATLPASTLRELAARVWDRYAADQVVEREDLAFLRARCPGVKIIIASASPRPSLEVAAERLGADDLLCSGAGEHDGYFSAPWQLDRRYMVHQPRRLAGPGALHINSGRRKLTALLARYPELGKPGVVSVGVSDTGYGEDHAWVELFTRVIDVNSPTPFPPVVPAGAPVREIHSALLLTRAERARRAAGKGGGWLDPRRKARSMEARAFDPPEMAARLGDLHARIEALAGRFDAEATTLAASNAPLAAELVAAEARIDRLVEAFNAAPEPARSARLRALRREARRMRALRRRTARAERPLSAIAFELRELLALARRRVGQERVARKGARP